MRTVSRRTFLAVALAAASTVVPTGSFALHNPQIAQCSGSATPGGAPAVCTATFELDQQRDPQQIGTHANFHALMSTGSVQMEWFDQKGVRVAHYVCQAPGLYVHRPTPLGPAVGGGPTDASSHSCETFVSNKAPFAIGKQTLVVTAQAEMCSSDDPRSCPFHGLLALKRVAEPI